MTTRNTGKTRLLTTQTPALPFAPVQYEQRYIDQFQRILTQYLTQNDTINNALLNLGGGYYLNFPHIAAEGDDSQYAAANNTTTAVKWTSATSNVGFTLNLDNSASAEYTGLYKIDYSLQFANTDTQIHEVYVWLAVKPAGAVSFTNVVGSSSKFSVPGKHGSSDGYLVAYSSLTFSLNGKDVVKDTPGDSVILYWSTSQHAGSSGTPTGVYMEAYPAQTVGSSSIPSNPASVGTIAFVSSIVA